MTYPQRPTYDTLDGAALYVWAQRVAQALNEQREAINALNVFPVPDSDTGSNMAFTMAAALREATKVMEINAQPGAHDVVHALAVGALRGARGNSGMVLGQVLRALAAVSESEPIGARAVVRAFSDAYRFTTEVIAQPVEGTIVTVLRVVADAVGARWQELGEQLTLAEVVTAAVTVGEDALTQTPSQLAVLRERGVVDAGAAGLMVLIRELAALVLGGALPEPLPPSAAHSTACPPPTPDTSEVALDGTYVELVFRFFIEQEENPAPDALESPQGSGPAPAENSAGDSIQRSIQQQLQGFGDSVIVSPVQAGEWLVHVHTHQAVALLAAISASGMVADLRVEALPDEISEGKPSQAASQGTAGAAHTQVPCVGASVHAAHDASVADVSVADAAGNVTHGDSTADVSVVGAAGNVAHGVSVADASVGFASAAPVGVMADAGPGEKDLNQLLVLAYPGVVTEIAQDSGAQVIRPDAPEGIREAISQLADTAPAGAAHAPRLTLLPMGHVGLSTLAEIEEFACARGVVITFVHTLNAVSALAALAVHDPAVGWAVDAFAMNDAASAVRTLNIDLLGSETAGEGGVLAAPAAVRMGQTIIYRAPMVANAVAWAADYLLMAGGEILTLVHDDNVVSAPAIAEILETALNASENVRTLRAQGLTVETYPVSGIRHLLELGVE